MIDFSSISSEHVDRALSRSGGQFPQDVYGLLRVFMHLLVIMDEGNVPQGPAADEQIDALIDDRLKALIESDERRLGELDESTTPIHGVSDTQH